MLVVAKPSRRWAVIGLLLIAIAATQWAGTGLGSAANSLSLSPFLQQIDIEPSDLVKTFNVQFTNQTAAPQKLQLSTRDLSATNQLSQKYGLANWLHLEATTLELSAGQSVSVSATIDNRPDLQPGGHYAAIVAAVSGIDANKGNKVAVSQELSSLVLVNKLGGARYDLRLAGTRHNGSWARLPTVVQLDFQNPGNVHVVPRGLVTLKTTSGKVVAQGIINDESAYVLPETRRTFYVTLIGRGSALSRWPGAYNLEINYRYDELNRYAGAKQQINFYSPVVVVGALILVLTILLRRYLKRIMIDRLSSKKSSA